MISLEEFRPGVYSLPAPDLDEVYFLCFSCLYLPYKEFSMDDGP